MFYIAAIGEISGPIPLDQYRVFKNYERTQPKELTVEINQVVDVVEKHENGKSMLFTTSPIKRLCM